MASLSVKSRSNRSSVSGLEKKSWYAFLDFTGTRSFSRSARRRNGTRFLAAASLNLTVSGSMPSLDPRGPSSVICRLNSSVYFASRWPSAPDMKSVLSRSGFSPIRASIFLAIQVLA